MIVIKNKIPLLSAMFFLGIPLMNAKAAESLFDTDISIRQEITVESCILDSGQSEYSYNIGVLGVGEMNALLKNKSSTNYNINEKIGILCPAATSAKYSLSVANLSDACTSVNGSGAYICSNPNNRSVGMYITTKVNAEPSTIHGAGMFNNVVKSIPLNDKGEGSFTIENVFVSPNIKFQPMPGPISANYILHLWGS